MPRVEQLNELLRSELAILVNKENLLRDGMITIISVDCSPDLENAKINFSVLPDKLNEIALKKLKTHTSIFSNMLRKRLKIKKIPRFYWFFDNTEKEVAELEKIFNKINQN